MTNEEKARFLRALPERLQYDPARGERGTLLVNLAMPLANEYFSHAAGIMECVNQLGWKVALYVRDRVTIDHHLEAFRAWVAQGHEIGIALSGPNGKVSPHLTEEAGVSPSTGRYKTGHGLAVLYADEDLVKMINYLKSVIKERLQIDVTSLHYIATPDHMVSVLQQTGITSLNVVCPMQKFFQADLFGGTDLWFPFALDIETPSFKTPSQRPAGEQTIVDCLWTTRDLLGCYYYHCSPHSTHPLDRLRGGEDALEYDYPHFIYDTIAQNSAWNAFGYIQFMMEMWIDLEGELTSYCDMFKAFLHYVADLRARYRVVSMTAREIRELYREQGWTLPPVAEVWTEFPRIAEVNGGYAQPSSPGGDAPLFLVATHEGRYVFSKSGKFFEPLQRFGYARPVASMQAPSMERHPVGMFPKQILEVHLNLKAPHLPVEIDGFTRGIVAINDVDYQFVRKLPEHPYVELQRELWLAPGQARQILIARHRAEREAYPGFGVAFWDTIPSRTTFSSIAHGQAATFVPLDLQKEWRVDRLEVDVSDSIHVIRQTDHSFILRNRLPARFEFEAIFLQIGPGFRPGHPRVKINGTEMMSSYDPDSGRLCFRGKIPAAGHDLRVIIE